MNAMSVPQDCNMNATRAQWECNMNAARVQQDCNMNATRVQRDSNVNVTSVQWNYKEKDFWVLSKCRRSVKHKKKNNAGDGRWKFKRVLFWQ